MRQVRLTLGLMALGAAGFAQTFEVATVKPAGPDRFSPNPLIRGPSRFEGGPGTDSPTRIAYYGVTLKMLLQRAYGITPNQIYGPKWMEEDRHDIAAALPAGTDAATVRVMLQNLLVERFRISLHHEMKPLPSYVLTIAKNGPKLKPPQPEPNYKDEAERNAALQANLNALNARYQAGEVAPLSAWAPNRATVAGLVQVLTANLGRPVKDSTGLTGEYAIRLEWLPDGARMHDGSPAIGPSITAAVEEQLGLKLEARDELIDALVIDRAERVPIEN